MSTNVNRASLIQRNTTRAVQTSGDLFPFKARLERSYKQVTDYGRNLNSAPWHCNKSAGLERLSTILPNQNLSFGVLMMIVESTCCSKTFIFPSNHSAAHPAHLYAAHRYRGSVFSLERVACLYIQVRQANDSPRAHTLRLFQEAARRAGESKKGLFNYHSLPSNTILICKSQLCNRNIRYSQKKKKKTRKRKTLTEFS